jgi:Na+:H+ antiporter, NhaA family
MSTPPVRKKVVLFARSSDQDVTTIAEILRLETVGGALMLAAATAALIWAGVDFESYLHFQHIEIGPLSLQHWAADGALTIFFFVAGLELKRELTEGSLSKPSQALVPIVAAACGMIAPALVYLAINAAAPTGRLQGWAVPMATDIAFALAILAVVGRSLPASMRAFLLTLAIVDDLGAILVIATVFTENVSLLWLLGALVLAGLWWLLQNRRVGGWWWWVPLGVLCWWCMYQAGVHPTIAGVLLGLLTRGSIKDPSAPLDRWEHMWRPVSAGVAVPVFAFLSAGVPISIMAFRESAADPVAIGIAAGLVVGKIIGIFGGAYLTARFTRAELAQDLRWRHVFDVSVLGGVGFTVALLVAELAFTKDPDIQEHAKTAVLVGSLIAAFLASITLTVRSRGHMKEGPNASPSAAAG